MSIYVQSNQIISELCCHRNLLTSSKTVPLCLKQVLVVRTSLIQISDTRTSFLTILRFLCVIFFIICHDFNPSMWHTQRMTNFITIFLWRFFSSVWHSLKYPVTNVDWNDSTFEFLAKDEQNLLGTTSDYLRTSQGTTRNFRTFQDLYLFCPGL